MQSKYKRAIVYDIESGGLSTVYNSITEIAMVAVDLGSLEIVEEMSVMFKPRIDLNWISTPIKDAKIIYKNTGTKDEESNIKTLQFKEHKITLKNLDPLVERLTQFYELIEKKYPSKYLEYKDILELESSEWKDVVKVFFDNCYNPQALEVTKISREMFEEEGLPHQEAYAEITEMIERHIMGNSKPVIVGHNIGSLPRRIVRGKEVGPDGFDNPFMEKLFKENGGDFFFSINDEIIDTLKWARFKWSELPSYSLGPCANEVGLTLKEAHRALPDTVANAKFFIKMMQHLRGEGSLKSRYKRKKFNFQM
jgi:DNA polymerase III alpha subunit (gram-positive type)